MITITMIIMFMTMNRLMMMTMRMMVKTKLIVHLPRPDTTQLLLLGKFEYTGGPIFKVVLEC